MYLGTDSEDTEASGSNRLKHQCIQTLMLNLQSCKQTSLGQVNKPQIQVCKIGLHKDRQT